MLTRGGNEREASGSQAAAIGFIHRNEVYDLVSPVRAEGVGLDPRGSHVGHFDILKPHTPVDPQHLTRSHFNPHVFSL